MSSKKINISELDLSTVGGRICYAREYRGLSPAQLSKITGIKKSSISEWESGKYNPGMNNLVKLSELLMANLDWIAHGQGEKFKDGHAGAIAHSEIMESTTSYSQDEGGLQAEIEILLGKARFVLESGTHYASSLASNINSFHCGCLTEMNFNRRLTNLELSRSSIRRDDPPEKRSDLLKLRA